MSPHDGGELKIDGFHLPGVAAPACDERSYPAADGAGASVVVRTPKHTPAEIVAIIDRLLAVRAEHLAERPVDGIIRAIDTVALRFLDEGDDLRRAALAGIIAVAGHSAPMARLVLDGMAADWRAAPLRTLVEAEFGDPRALDDFVARGGGGGRARAFGPDLTLHVFSGNVPGVSVTSLIRALLVKSASLGKTAGSEPVLAPLFASALAEADPGLGTCVAVTHWRGGDRALEDAALARTSAVVVYGGTDAVRSLRERTPDGTTFLGYRHRVSFGVATREALGAGEASVCAADAAMAVATFDQHGCVSPHLFYVEEGGETAPAAWAAMLAQALEALETALPRGVVTPGESAAIRQARAAAEFGQLAGDGRELHASANGTAWTVVFDPDPVFTPSCLNRVVTVKPFTSIDELTKLVEPTGPILQTVGFAGDPERRDALAARLGALGASRITTFRDMPWPSPTWHHDGRPQLAELVRWCDIE